MGKKRKTGRSKQKKQTLRRTGPNGGAGPMEAGLRQLRAGRAEKALPLFEAVLKQEPDHCRALYLAGLALHLTGRSEEGIPLLERACEQQPDSPDIWFNRGKLLRDTGRLDEAVACYNRAVQLRPDYHSALFNLGNTCVEAGMLAEALDAYQRALDLAPQDGTLRFNMANLLLELGRAEAAVSQFQILVELLPGSADVHHHLALALERLDRTGDARLQYEKAIELDAGHERAHNNLAVLLHKMGRIEEAKQHYEKALSQRPGYPDAMNNLGNILREQGLPEQAISLYHKVLAKNGRHAEAWGNLATAHKDLDQSDDALAAYNKALEIRPDYVDVHLNLTRTLQQAGRLDEALAGARRTVEIQDDGQTRFRLGAVLQEMGQTEAAAREYERCLAHSPDDAWGAELCLALLGKKKAPERASNAFVRGLFDYYAAHFDAHLQEALEYKGPAVIHKILANYMAPAPRLDILDLGCGTGLCGMVLKPHAKSLTGVDLSAAMIEQARKRGIFDALHVEEVTVFLERHPRTYDLIAAGDVLVYLGDLAPVFRAAAGALRQGGLFAFTVERRDAPGFSLTGNMRYAHNRDYLARTARDAGLGIKDIQPISTRKEEGQPVPGWGVLLCAET